MQKLPQFCYSAGFTYLGLLFFIAIMGITLALASTLWSFSERREKEHDLLFVGSQFRQAIGLYYERTPGAVKKYPHTLEDLLQDDRYVIVQRYLRRIYRDPITNQQQWGLVLAPTGGIMGVYSRSESVPIKTVNFRYENRTFEKKNKYQEWKFVYEPLVVEHNLK